MAGGREGDFPEATKRLLAERAGQECSVPFCDVRTVGPGAKPDETAKVGQASHIYSAGENGPRGRGGLTPDQLASPENGIWTCELHGKAIDNNAGLAYPAGLLRAWKKSHEDRIQRASIGRPADDWIDRIVVNRSPLLAPATSLDFGKVTVLSGVNGIGKTAVCEWVAGIRGAKPLWRWTGKKAWHALNYEVHYARGGDHVLAVDVPVGGEPGYALDSLRQVAPPSVIDAVHLERRYLQSTEGDDRRGLASLFSLDPTHMGQLAESVGANGDRRFRHLGFEPEIPDEGEAPESVLHDDGEPHMHLVVETYSPSERFPLANLGGGAHTEVLLSLAAELARAKSKHHPTLLILDAGDWAFAGESFASVADAIDRCAESCQVLLVEPMNHPDRALMAAREWVRYELASEIASASGARIVTVTRCG